MAKTINLHSFFKYLFLNMFLFFFATSFSIAAQPGFIPDDWETALWTSNSSRPSTGIDNWIKVVDYDGFSPDGTSHEVMLTYPDLTTRTISFQYRENDVTAVYGFWDNNDPTSDPTRYSGDYVYRITDTSTGEWSEMIDSVIVSEVDPPDETYFSPGYGSPVSIKASFDNVFVNGELYDDFNSGLDPSKWESQPSGSSITDQVNFEYQWDTAEGRVLRMRLQNPEAVNELRATVRITGSVGDNPNARIGGTFCNDGVGDLIAMTAIRGNEALSMLYRQFWEGNHYILSPLFPITNLGPVTPGNRYELTLGWDGSTFSYKVQGIDDTILYTHNYTPSGAITSAVSPERYIGISSFSTLDTTTPTFNWNEVTGATYYRVRLYTANDTSIYTGNTKAPPYKLPPGILKPNALYKYRIYAINDHQWFDADNVAVSDRNLAWFIAGPNEAQEPYVDLSSSGVHTWNSPEPIGVHATFYLRIHDAQGVPGNIKSVKAILPDTSTEVTLYPDHNETPTCAIYTGDYLGPVQSGEYKIKVVDKDLNEHIQTEVLTVDPVGYPAISSLLPADHAVVGSTGVSFDWEDVPGAGFYELKVYDKEFNQLLNLKTIQSQYTLPPGFLKEAAQYRYRVLPRREFFEDNNDNGTSSPPWGTWNAQTFFTTEKYGTALPEMNLNRSGVSVWHGPHPVTGVSVYELDFQAMVTDTDGVPENIKKVEVTFPDGTTKRILKFHDEPNLGINYYEYVHYLDPSLIQDVSNSSGVYTFEVKDFDNHTVTLYDTLPQVIGTNGNALPFPVNETPVNGTLLPTTTPEIAWDPLPGASYYRVRVINASGNRTLYWSNELVENRCVVPCGILEPDTTYAYRIYAYKEAPGEEVDFYSSSGWGSVTNPRFTTGNGCTGDFDQDDDIDGKDLYAFIQQLSQGNAPITLKSFCDYFGSSKNIPQEEVCGDNIDNDQDGLVDEDCIPIPSGTIAIDGDPDDWGSIQPMISDVQGDSNCEVGTDIKSVYLAKDDTYLYWRVDTHSGNFTFGTSEDTRCLILLFYEGQALNGPYPNGITVNISNPDSGYVSARYTNHEWTGLYGGPEYGTVGTVAEGRIPLAEFTPFAIEFTAAYYWNGTDPQCDWASLSGQLAIK